MKLFKTLEALMPAGDCSRLAYYGDTPLTRKFCKYYTKMHDIEFFNLQQLPLSRWSFGGEFFEVMIIEDDSFLEKDAHIKMVKKALQKNRNLVFISEVFQASDLQEKLEPFGFSDFATIEDEPFVSVTRKWFVF